VLSIYSHCCLTILPLILYINKVALAYSSKVLQVSISAVGPTCRLNWEDYEVDVQSPRHISPVLQVTRSHWHSSTRIARDRISFSRGGPMGICPFWGAVGWGRLPPTSCLAHFTTHGRWLPAQLAGGVDISSCATAVN
jgi:hypothetical protein